jgi:3-deoxy-D-manno-octulosonic-acid transferase
MAEERRSPLSAIDLPAGRPVYWFHAVSMGEVGVAAILIRELKAQAPDALAVVSTATPAGYESAKTKIAEADAVVAARFDLRPLVASMFEAIRPDAVILVEGDLWRNTIAIARRRGVPVFLANGKLSEKSLAFYRRFPIYSRSLLSRIAHVYAQTDLYRQRLEAAGLPPGRCDVAGNVKLDTIAPPHAEDLAGIARTLGCDGTSPVVTFGSLHPGEEIAAVRAMQQVWRDHPRAHGIIVPRHIEKTPQFAESIRREFGLECRIYSRCLDAAPEEKDVSDARLSIVDRMGMLMKLYALADVGVVGGTFIEGIGGHNLTEPAFSGKPVLYGPHAGKQLGLHDLVAEYDAGRQTTPEALPGVLAALIADPAEARRLGANGERMVADSRGIASRIVADILRRTQTERPTRTDGR